MWELIKEAVDMGLHVAIKPHAVNTEVWIIRYVDDGTIVQMPFYSNDDMDGVKNRLINNGIFQ